MGVQLNIKDARTVELARDLAARLGKSVTETVREALEEKARRRQEDIDRRMAEFNAILADIHAQLPDEVKAMSFEQIMDIYDEDESGR